MNFLHSLILIVVVYCVSLAVIMSVDRHFNWVALRIFIEATHPESEFLAESESEV